MGTTTCRSERTGSWVHERFVEISLFTDPNSNPKKTGRLLPFIQTIERTMGYCQYTSTVMECERRINSYSPITSEIDVNFAIYVAIT